MKAALEHHFNNHSFCNPSWCQFRDNFLCKSTDIARAKLQNINANPANKIVYDEVKQIHELFTTCKHLLMLLHPFDSQKNEGIEPRICKASPKEHFFQKQSHCLTILYSLYLSILWGMRQPFANFCQIYSSKKTMTWTMCNLDRQEEKTCSRNTS